MLVFFHGCRKLYWSDQGSDSSGVPAKIARANMDGTFPQVLYTGNLGHLEFITIDIEMQILYWAVTSTGVVCTPYWSLLFLRLYTWYCLILVWLCFLNNLTWPRGTNVLLPFLPITFFPRVNIAIVDYFLVQYFLVCA